MATIAPIDYRGFLNRGSADLGASLSELGDAIGLMRKNQAAQEAARQQAEQYSADVAEALKTPTPQVMASLTLKYPKQREAIKQAWDGMDEATRRAEGGAMAQSYSALLAGDSAAALGVVDEQINARKNSGLDVGSFETARKLIEKNPTEAAGQLGLILAHITDPKTFAAQFGALGKEQRERQLQTPSVDRSYAEAQEAQSKAIEAAAKADVAERTADTQVRRARVDVQNVQSQIQERAARLGLDQDRLISETETKIAELKQKNSMLPDSAVKIVNDAAGAAVAADLASKSALDLAEKFERLGGGYGTGATIAEKFASVTGNQDALSAARQEYIRLRNNAAIKSLPPGPATDRDIQLALKGFPPENADSAYIASFMRGMAKMQQREAAYETARSEWVNVVGNMGKARQDVEVDGVRVPVGATFIDFTRKYLGEKTKARGAAQDAERAGARSYMRFATPGAQ